MGPLDGFKLIEIAGIGPSQLCGMVLADMGAQIIRIDRPTAPDLGVAIPARFNLMNRSRPTIAVDLKTPAGVDLVLRLCESADGLFEGFRPGVMEKLGLGPSQCMDRNERLVYGRMTGWGQEGPLASSAGHDTNYIALAGALGSIGDSDRPPPVPLNLVGDFGGGALYLAMGMLAAMLEVTRSGKGQVVDAAIVDGVANMMTLFYGLQAGGIWSDARQSNLLDGAAPFFRNYETLDGKYVAVGALEARFFKTLLETMEITDINPADQHKRSLWPDHQKKLASRFKQKTRDQWQETLQNADTCATPIMSQQEAPDHPHNQARNSYLHVDGIRQPAPAPRFSRTPSSISHPATEPGDQDQQALFGWGLNASEIEQLTREGVLHSQ